MANSIRVMFLGGLEEIGKNITVFESCDQIVVVDCGLCFPTAEMPGVDVVIPDVSYLKENAEKIKGILLTHGHEDHIGAVPYVLKELGKDIPVFATPLTLALVESKLTEHGIFGADLISVTDGTVVSLGVFTAEFIHVCHSVAGSLAISLSTPVGTVFITGDYKIDFTPLAGEVMSLSRVAEIGRKGVALMLADSTNVERPGYTMSEQVVAETLKRIFGENTENRIIVTTFASNVDRVQIILDLAREFNRKVAVSGLNRTEHLNFRFFHILVMKLSRRNMHMNFRRHTLRCFVFWTCRPEWAEITAGAHGPMSRTLSKVKKRGHLHFMCASLADTKFSQRRKFRKKYLTYRRKRGKLSISRDNGVRSKDDLAPFFYSAGKFSGLSYRIISPPDSAAK